MKRLISLALAISIGCSALFIVDTVQARTVCTCKNHPHQKHHRKYYRSSELYMPGYCEYRQCGCCKREYCYPGYTLRCHTDYYYHRGRNTARVEVCD